MQISTKDWLNYIKMLSGLNTEAGKLMQEYVQKNGFGNTDAIIDYAYGLVTKYGEGSAALAAEMYDETALLSGMILPPAEVADTAGYGEIAKAIHGTIKHSKNPNSCGSTVSRYVKMAGADTTLKNAKRDGAQFAWVPMGDTCSFCLTLASRGWQNISRKTMRKGHAEHIHANCDCTYSVRFDGKSGVKGYDPDKYLAMYNNAEGGTPQEKINSMRRMQYQDPEVRNKIRAQKREAYAEKKGIVGVGSDKTEKSLNYTFAEPNKAILSFEDKARKLKNERAIITTPDGKIWDEAQGKGNRVTIDTPNEAGYTFSHNHPIDANFSVADVKGFEKAGYKQIRAASPDNTYILEAVNPIQKKEAEDRLFTSAMADAWDKLDEESAQRRKAFNEKAMEIADREKRTNFAIKESQKLLDWRMEAEDKWLQENAPKYGYHYKRQKVN